MVFADTLMLHLPVLIIAIPLLIAFILPILHKINESLRNIITIIAVLLNVVMCVLLAIRVFGGNIIHYVLGGIDTAITMPSGKLLPIRIILEVDSFGILIAIAVSIVALAAILYSTCFMRQAKDSEIVSGKYYALFMLVLASMNGMLFTGDLFNLFVFFEILSLASVGLVLVWRGDDESPEAAFKYILISTIAALFVLFAVGILYAQYGALNIAALSGMLQYTMLDKVALCMLIAGFAMKLGVVPVHMWVADVYGRSPAPVTALFVVISQISLYALVRTLFTLFGLTLNVGVVGWIIIVLALLSMIVGVFMALPQRDIKRVIAYQGVSQTGYLLLGLGVGLVVISDPIALNSFGTTAMAGSIFHIFNHALYESLLFLVAGAIFYKLGTRNLNEMGGLAKTMPLVTVLFVIGMFAIAGVPPFNGFASKFMIYESVFKFSPLIAMIAIVVSIITLAAFMKIFYVAFLAPARMKQVKSKSASGQIPVLMIVAMVLLAACVVLAGLFPGFIVDNMIRPAVDALVNQAGYVGAIIA